MDFWQCGVGALAPMLFKGQLYLNTYYYHYCCSLKILLFGLYFFFYLTVILQRVLKLPDVKAFLFSEFVNLRCYYVVVTLLPVLFLSSGIYRLNVKAFMTIQMSYVTPDINNICKICNIILFFSLNFCFGKYSFFPLKYIIYGNI